MPFDIDFLCGKKAAFEFTVSSESYPIAGSAKMPAQWCNEPHLAKSAG
jgi:hypothetical protein